MKAPLALGIGLAIGAIIASTLLLVLRSHDYPVQSAELDTLRENLSLARKEAQRDRDAVRAVIHELEAIRKVAQLNPSPSVAMPAQPTVIPSASAIAAYLGVPISAPPILDRRYSPEELAAVFRDLAETLGIKIDNLAVDTTEFPFILYGRIESSAGAGFFKKIDSDLKALPGYTYGGSVTGGGKDGSTHFALNMTPSRAYPREHAEAINRRLMLRLQIAAAVSREPNP